MIRKGIAAVIAAGIMAVGFASPASAATHRTPAPRGWNAGATVIVPAPMIPAYEARGYVCTLVRLYTPRPRLMGHCTVARPAQNAAHVPPFGIRPVRPYPIPGLPNR